MRICLNCATQLHSKAWSCPACGWEPEVQAHIPILSPEVMNGFGDYPADQHDRIAKLEATSFWFRCRNQIIMQVLNHFFPSPENLLEVGCGTGFVLAHIAKSLPGIDLVGAEAYPSALEYAKERVQDAELVQLDIYRLPYSEEFKIVGAFDVLEHMSDDMSALRQIYGATQKGGGVILTVPQHPWLWSALDDMAGHKRRYTRQGLKNKVEAAGFKVAYMTSFITLLLPLMIISRLKKGPQRKLKSDTVQCELNLSKPLNAVFISICSLEFLLIRKGYSLPAGGSLVCVAKKS